MPPVSASKLLTIGQYLVDVKEARQGVKPLLPLVQSPGPSSTDCERLRMELRKPPLQGIRKACNKCILQLEEGSPLRATKETQYTAIKKSLASVDDACREGVDRSQLDLPAMLATLGEQLKEFETGFGIAAD